MTVAELDASLVTLSAPEAAARLGLEPGTLANWRWSGHGPRYVKIGGRVRYRLSDLATWLDHSLSLALGCWWACKEKPTINIGEFYV